MAKLYLLHHLLDEAAGSASSSEAVIDLVGTRRSVDYRGFRAMAASCATVLQQQGLQRRDRVAICLGKSVEEAAGVFAASMAGGVFVIINPLLLGHQAAHIVRDSGAKFLVTSRGEWERVRDEVVQVESLECVLLIDRSIQEHPDGGKQGLTVLSDVMRPDGNPPQDPASIGEDLAGLLYTSGSTGKPRGVMLSHRNLLAGTRIVGGYLGIQSSDRLISILPFSFDYGLNQLLTSVQNHASITLFQYRLPADLVRILQQEAITGLAGVPVVWAGLTHRTSGLSSCELPALRYLTNTGGAVPTTTVRALRKLLPNTRIFLMYGLTEAFRATYLPPEEVDCRPNSIGKAIPESEILVVNSEGKPCKPGEPGILVQRGPTVSLGYWGNPERTREVLRPHPFIPPEQGGDTVCYSGDLVQTDEAGFIYFIARDDGQIKSQGYRVSPSEVEEILMETGELSHAAVIGLPTPDAGEMIHAIVVPAAGKSVDVEAALRHCGERLPGYMTPKSVEVVKALPITPNGKVDYQTLRAERVARTP